MSDDSNSPGSLRTPLHEAEDDSGTVTLPRYGAALQPALPFAGAPRPPPAPAAPSAAPATPAPAHAAAPPPAPPAAWPAPVAAPSTMGAPPGAAPGYAPMPPSSPWSTRAPMPTAIPRTPTAEAPPPPPLHGALAASNAATAPAAPWSAPRPVAAVPIEPAPAARLDPLRLVWFDEGAVPRIRRVPAYRPILARLESEPLDRQLDDPAGEPDPMLVEDRREVFEIAARAAATDGRGVHEALLGAVRPDGKFAPPMVLVAGELETPFDELAQLEATIAVTIALAAAEDRETQAALETAQRFLANRGKASARPTARALTTRVREAIGREKKHLVGYLDDHVLRSLREERAFQRREVLGEPHLRLLLHAGEDAPLLVYVPASVAAKLPMFTRFSARIIAEIHLPEDESEAAPCALRALALARRVNVPRPT